MDRFARELFGYSAPDPSHHETLRNRTEDLSEQDDELVKSVFWHYPAIYGYSKNKAPKQYGDGPQTPGWMKPPSGEWMAWQFYKRAYAPPVVRRDTGGTAVSINDFCDILARPPIADRRNRLFFLQGDVGCGKTAFLNYIITTKGKELFTRKNAWFMRYNVDVENRGNEEISAAALTHGLCKKLSTVIKRMKAHHPTEYNRFKPELIKSHQLLDSASPQLNVEELREIFSSAVTEVSRILGKQFILILDNLDSFFHQNDRYLFLQDRLATGEDSIAEIYNIVGQFYMTTGQLSRMGINVVFVLRPESYLALERSRDFYPGQEHPYSRRANLFNIETPHWVDVVRKRVDLLDIFIQKVRPASQSARLREGFKNFRAALMSQVDSSLTAQDRMNTLSALRHLCNQGIRDVLMFFYEHTYISSFASQPEFKDIPFNRYIRFKPIGLMAFMMGGRCKYSQVESRFPNLFLVNVEALDEGWIASRPDGGEEDAIEYSSDHTHTFWLKYLILKYIQSRNENNRVVRLGEILDVFCTEDEDQDEYYDEIAVRMCLGSLCERNVSNLVMADKAIARSGALFVSNLRLNDRAKYCLHFLFNRFFYLQLTLDDWALPLPVEFRDMLKDYDYRYLTFGHGYFQNAKRMVNYKAEMTCRFIGILDAAAEAERKKFRPVHESLAKKGIVIPDLEEDCLKPVVEEIMLVAPVVEALSGNSGEDRNALSRAFENERASAMKIFGSLYD